jgi:excisionase family DNA binding protein
MTVENSVALGDTRRLMRQAVQPSFREGRSMLFANGASRWTRDLANVALGLQERYGNPMWSVDLEFLAFLESFEQFGFFRFGPISIDVRAVEAMYSKSAAARPSRTRRTKAGFRDDFVRFTNRLMKEVERSGRKRLDELHYLLTFMRTPEGLPLRVFGKLPVSAEQVEQFARNPVAAVSRSGAGPERLYTIEDVAAYYGVHAQTVRAWIRSGRLPAVRLAAQKAIRVRERDLESVLAPFSSDKG